jgi:type III restriction enzyme
VQEAKVRYEAKQITIEEFMAEVTSQTQSETFPSDNGSLEIRRIANHYYIPVILSENERIEYIRSIIHVASEVQFLRLLEEYIRTKDNRFKNYDWWLFSRVDEKYDEINIPYYYPFENRIANFKPDFIFWLQKGKSYQIIFVDPKGTGRTEYEHKVDGFRRLFEEEDKPKVFHYDEINVKVHLFLYTPDTQNLADGYRKYWFDNIDEALKTL